ncbi:HNH endonuclease [Curtobacterium sp. VKM Ac-2861]|uniref:HNH endonuclease n=1 Tax=Curtobacterium sp. VKM Ac-2861 TaxID=2739016 RepID=UPI00349EC356
MGSRPDLESRRWRAQCVRIKARDGACTSCGNPEDLTVDHISPPSVTGIPGDQYPDHMLTTLCRPCNSSKGDRPDARLHYRNPRWS